MIVTAYALLPPDPATQAHLAVITSGNEGTLTLSVGGQNVEVAGAQIPSRSEYIYHFRVSNLRPATVHPWSIPGLGDGLPLKTLPGAMPPGGLTVCIISDVHTFLGPNHMTAVTDMDVVRDQSPDFLFVAGDQAFNNSFTFSETNGGRWIDLFENWYSRLSVTHLVPIIAVPGNHDVGNGSWTGTEAVDPDGTYFRVFQPSIADVEPLGLNYGVVRLGDYVEFWGLDTHSAPTASLGAWLDTVTAEAPTAIPVMHSPLFASNARNANDPVLQAAHRDAVGAKVVSETPVSFAGHLHIRTRSIEMGFFASDPGGDRFVISQGFLAPQEGGHVQVGQGYSIGRTGSAEWFLEETQNGVKQFNRLDLSQGSLRVRTVGTDGGTLFDRTWTRPRSRRVQPVRADGTLGTFYGADGNPVYPRSA